MMVGHKIILHNTKANCISIFCGYKLTKKIYAILQFKIKNNANILPGHAGIDAGDGMCRVPERSSQINTSPERLVPNTLT